MIFQLVFRYYIFAVKYLDLYGLLSELILHAWDYINKHLQEFGI